MKCRKIKIVNKLLSISLFDGNSNSILSLFFGDERIRYRHLLPLVSAYGWPYEFSINTIVCFFFLFRTRTYRFFRRF